MPIFALLLNFLNLRKFIPLIIRNWKPILIGAMAFLLWYENFNETRFLLGMETIPSLKKQLVAATTAVSICKAGNDKLSEAIDERNAEVQVWKRLSIGLEEDVKGLQGRLDAERVKTNTQVQTILKDVTPKTCEASIDYLRDGRKDLQWKK